MHRSTAARTRRTTATLLTGTVLALGLGACSGGGSSDSSSGSARQDSSRSQVGAVGAAPQAAAGAAFAAGSAPAARPPVESASVIKTGEVSLVGKDLAKVRSRIDQLLAATGGSLDDERSKSGRDGAVRRSTLVLRVPVARFDAVKHAIEGLGTLRSSTEKATDVTTRVIDVRERVQTLQNSLDRLQRFQRSATDVRDLIRFEDDITSRQAELQSLKSQQSYLADQTSLSTITVRLATPAVAVAQKEALDGAGFLPGLRHGWDALVGFAVVVLTALGAALPWLVVLAALGWPALVLVRRRARRTTPSPSA